MAADNLLRLSGYFGGDDGLAMRREAAKQLSAAFAIPETPQAYPELTASLVTAILGPKQVRKKGRKREGGVAREVDDAPFF